MMEENQKIVPLIDADVLLHELGWSGEFKDKETGELILFDFDKVQELLDNKIATICAEVWATDPPILFITNSEWLTERMNKQRRRRGEEEKTFVPTFRYNVAKTKPYKGTRKNPKPFHFYNIIAYLMSEYDVRIADDGLEADDAICTYQYGRSDTIICSRDKDLRICPGWHYSWECGKQGAVGPVYTDRVGSLGIGSNGKTLGYGLTFFYYQMLVGDSADNIPGLPKCGDVGAKKLLEGATTEEDLYTRVKTAYIEKLGKEVAKDYFMEQAQLLWMIQEKGKGYELPRMV